MLSLRNVDSISSLLRYCSDHLGWPIDEDFFEDIDEILYDFGAADLGLQDDEFARIKSLQQLRPLSDDQPWGIFVVEFVSKRLSVTSLRKILGKLVPSANNTDFKTWNCNNLLFLCIWGEQAYRTIGFVAFEKQEGLLPAIKVEYCTPKLEERQVRENFEQRISGLAWPSTTNNAYWVASWHAVFMTKYQQTIRDTQQLTIVLASSARTIADHINHALSIESDSGSTKKLFRRFNNTLAVVLTPKEFADMYAQTIVYGLFSARCMQPALDSFDMKTAIAAIPPTNPLLRDLLIECSQDNSIFAFDEFHLGDLIDALKAADITSILCDFNRQTGDGREDPIVYFYEKFLDIYEREQKKRRGVYFTPTPVVDYIVTSILQILDREFSCKSGFLDSSVVVLDPATGTGTFLRKVILEAHREYQENTTTHKAFETWNEFVGSSLLGRIYGFEFMMAPYAVAHMKLALTLRDTGYIFERKQRLQIYLANSLEHQDLVNPNVILSDPLAKETAYAAAVKESRINIIVGNPPYRTDSINQSQWIMALMDDYKKEPGTNDRLNERNPKVINDDYVKFIRLATEILKNKDNAIVAYVIPHSYMDNLTFRGMRWQLLKEFDSIYIYDLHGNVMSHERGDGEEREENVFDIQQGVCISFFIKKKKTDEAKLAQVYYADSFGTREKKYTKLRSMSFNKMQWTKVIPSAPDYFLKPKNTANSTNYASGISLNELFPFSLVGIKTSDDARLISLTPYNTSFDQLIDYRPFDIRHINYDRSLVERDRYDVVKHFIGHDNYGLVINRQVANDNWSHIQIVRNMIDNRTHYSRKGNPFECPMLLFDDNGIPTPNVSREKVQLFEDAIGLSFSDEILDTDHTFDVLDLFDYCYAVLFSPHYRKLNIDLLSSAFPKVPVPQSSDQFWCIAAKGKELRLLHTMEKQIDNVLNISFEGIGDNIINAVCYDTDKLYVNRTQYFSNVRFDLWDFCFGGYRGLSKWFKDRKQQVLSADDKTHIIRVFNIFNQTQNLMSEIDDLLLEYGWI